MSHTPGPWKLTEYPTGRVGQKPLFTSIMAQGVWVAAAESDPHHYGTMTATEVEANARLIAAAPEMIDMVKLLRSICMGMPKPQIGDWDWPEIKGRCDSIMSRIAGGIEDNQ